MKKIVALVLAMVMVLGLATVAFGADVVTAKSFKSTADGVLVVGDETATFAAAVAPVLNADGKQTNTANVAYYNFIGTDCVVVDSLAAADFVLYSDAAGKNVMMYLKKAVVAYAGSGTAYTNFGKACGQVNYAAEAGKTYYTSNAVGSTGIYVADVKGTMALMVGGQMVTVSGPVADTTFAEKHAAVPTVKDGKVTGYTCAACKVVAVEAPNFMSIPKGASQDGLAGNWYWTAAVEAPATDKVESAQTFDAGIAMYVGMSVMAAAGSAVVLKKKD